MSTPREDRAEAVQRRLDSVFDRFSPSLGLVIGLALTPLVIRDGSTRLWALIGVLVAVTCLWSWYFATRQPVRAAEPVAGVVYVAGYLVLMAALVHLSPLFGFMAFAAYGHAFTYLRGRWRWVTVGAAAVLVAYAQMGGRFTDHTPLTLLGLGVLVAANGLLAGGLAYLGALSSENLRRRGEVIAELEETNRRLSEALEENARLHAQLLAQAREAGVLDERQRMAREIHDTIAQGLAGIVTQLEAAEAAGDDADARRRHLDTARALARESLAEARRSVQALAPPQLENAHLPEAISDLAARWSETSGVPVDVRVVGEPRPLLAELEVTLFRVTQEALTNVAKHARAHRVEVTLSYSDLVVVDIRDDGVGFVTAGTGSPPGTGFGLRTMRQRIQAVGGVLEIESEPGEGTAVSAGVPVVSAAAGTVRPA